MQPARRAHRSRSGRSVGNRCALTRSADEHAPNGRFVADWARPTLFGGSPALLAGGPQPNAGGIPG
jgi:hypothetical protein